MAPKRVTKTTPEEDINTGPHVTENSNSAEKDNETIENESGEMPIGESTSAEDSDFIKRVNEAVQKRLDEEIQKSVQQQLSSFFSMLNNSGNNMSILNNQVRYQQPVFTLPNFNKEEKLNNATNYSLWKQNVENGLESLGLLSYIEDERNEKNIPEEVWKIRNAQSLQYIKATVSTDIASSLSRVKSAYEAFKQLAINYGDQRFAENIRLERRQRKLIFRPWHDKQRFVNDFQKIISDYQAIGTNFEDEPLIAKFLAMLDLESGGVDNGYTVFFDVMQTIPKEFRTFENVKARFLNFIPSKSKTTKPEKRKMSSPSSSSTSQSTDKAGSKRTHSDRSQDNEKSQRNDRSSSKHRPTIKDLVTQKQPVRMEDLYSLEQRIRLKTLTQPEKSANQCETCLVYFHTKANCPYKTKLCYKCYRFGHEKQNCTEGKLIKSLSCQTTISGCYDADNELNAHFNVVINFIVDSGATHHAVSDQNLILDYKSYETPLVVQTAVDSENSLSLGYGFIPILLNFDTTSHIIKLSNVQLVEDIEYPTLSVQSFNTQNETSVILNTATGVIVHRTSSEKIALIQLHEGLFKLQANVCLDRCYLYSNFCTNDSVNSFINNDTFCIKISKIKLKPTSLKKKKKQKLSPKNLQILKQEGEIWHSRMAHISAPYLNKIKYITDGVPEFIFNKTMTTCQICNQSKMTRKVFDRDREGAAHPCQILHADLITISVPTFPHGNRYILTLLDDFTRYLQTFVIKNKTDVPNCLQQALTNLKTMFPANPYFRYLRCDNGPEFIGKSTISVLDKFDIQLQIAEPHAHEHNGTIERLNRTLEERIRALLFTSGFPKSFWGFATHCATYLYNRTPHSAIDFITPYEQAFNKKPDLSYIRIFGSRVYVYDDNVALGNKVASRSTIQYLIGYRDTGYVTYHPQTNKTNNVCSVKIDERIQYKHDYPSSSQNETFNFSEKLDLVDHEISGNKTATPGPEAHSSYDTSSLPMDHGSHVSEDEQPATQIIEESIDYDWDSEPVTIAIKSCKMPTIFEPYNTQFDKDFHSMNSVPLTYKQATNTDNKHEWIDAIQTELNSMSKHNVWEIVPYQKPMSVIPVKWVFGIKSDGRKRARLVAVGCRDPETYTSVDTASPTPSIDTTRWIFAHCSYHKLPLIQLDIKTAFLHSKLDRTKYITLPPGIEGNSKTHVAKLNKALYGLATAPKCWYNTFDKFMTSIAFQRSCREPCLYTKFVHTTVIIVLMYVDDILITSSKQSLIDKIIESISANFDTKVLGFPKHFLGIDIHLDENLNISLSQHKYIDNLLQEFRMHESKPVSTPILKNNENNKIDKIQPPSFHFRSAIGSLLYLANNTRPDITFAVHFLARFQCNPQDVHYIMIKRILRYLNGTRSHKLKYDKVSENILESYVDASFRDDPTTGKSTTGYLIRYHGNIIAWRSRVQHSVAHSTTEAEYLAITDAASDILFLGRMTEETTHLTNVFPVTIFEDNSGCITQTVKTTSRGRLKHLEKKYLDYQKHFENKEFKAVKVDTKNQLADILTKPLPTDKFMAIRAQILD